MIISVEIKADSVGLEKLDALTRQLRNELLLLDVEDVALASEEQPSDGAKGDAITIGALVVGLANSAALAGACQVLRTWVSRDQGRRVTIKLKAGKPVSVEVTGQNLAQHQQLIDSFLKVAETDTEAEQKGP